MAINRYESGSFRYEIVPMIEDHFFWARFEGELSLNRIGKAHDALTSHPEFTSGVDELLDFTRTSIAWMSPGDVNEMRVTMREQTERHHCKSALVVNTKPEFGLARMLGGTMATNVPVERGVFYSVREALDWLRPGQAEALERAYELARIESCDD